MNVNRLGQRTVDGNVNMVVPWMLMGSYAYYNLSSPLIDDSLYDEWALRLHRTWDRVKHRHKSLIIRGLTTCRIMIRYQYPEITKDTAHLLLSRKS
jgi:hypothetical protein